MIPSPQTPIARGLGLIRMTKTALIRDADTPDTVSESPGRVVAENNVGATSREFEPKRASTAEQDERRRADPGRARRSQKRRAWRWIAGAAIPLALLGVWHLVTTSGLIPPYQLSTPGAVWEALIDLNQRGELLGHVAISTQRVLLGFTFGAASGLALGAIVGLSPLSRSLLAPTIGALRAVPSLAWVPLLILWLKIGEESKVTLIAIGAFFPVYTTFASALRHVDRQLIEVGRTYGLKGVALLRSIYLPAATPPLISGLRLGLAQAWLFLVAAELIASSIGLGFLLTDSQNNGRVDRLLLAILLLAVLGKITDSLVGIAERRVLRRWA